MCTLSNYQSKEGLNSKISNPFIIKNFPDNKANTICLPLSKERAPSVREAKRSLLCVSKYFSKKVTETLKLFQLDQNGDYVEIAFCVVESGRTRIFDSKKSMKSLVS